MKIPSINKGKDNIMARIVGVDIPRNKKIAFSLCYIHGIGMSTALEICKTAKIDTDKRVQDLSEKQISSIREVISFTFSHFQSHFLFCLAIFSGL